MLNRNRITGGFRGVRVRVAAVFIGSRYPYTSAAHTDLRARHLYGDPSSSTTYYHRVPHNLYRSLEAITLRSNRSIFKP